MGINVELLTLLVGIIFQGLFIAHRMGKFEEKLNNIEKKQDKHNSLIERMVKVEDSTKSAHLRLDNLEDNCHKTMRKWLDE